MAAISFITVAMLARTDKGVASVSVCTSCYTYLASRARQSVNSVLNNIMMIPVYLQTAILSFMYLSAVSYVLIATGIIIHNVDEYPDYINIQFAGSFLISFFAVCYIVTL